MDPNKRKKIIIKTLFISGIIFVLFSSLFYWLIFYITIPQANTSAVLASQPDQVDINELKDKLDSFLGAKGTNKLIVTKNEIPLIKEILTGLDGYKDNIEFSLSDNKFIADICLPVTKISGFRFLPFLGNRIINGQLVFSIRKLGGDYWSLHLEEFKIAKGNSITLNYFLITKKLPKEWSKVKSIRLMVSGLVIES